MNERENELIEMLHHNRDREALLSCFNFMQDIPVLDYHFDNKEFLWIMRNIWVVEHKIPKYKTQMKIQRNTLNALYHNDYWTDPQPRTTTYDIGMIQSIDFQNLAKKTPKSKIYPILKGRGVTLEQIEKFQIISSEYLTEEQRWMCGAMHHPALLDVMRLNPKEICQVIPIRNLSHQIIGTHCRYTEQSSMKFTSSIPNLFLYHNLSIGEDLRGKDVYLVEGVFDALALDYYNPDIKWFSLSSGFFSMEQSFLFHSLYNQMLKDANVIAAFDNDGVGMRSNLMMSMMYDTPILKLPIGTKDIAELIIRDHMKLEDQVKISHQALLKDYQDYIKGQPGK